MKIQVTNLSNDVNEEDLTLAFGAFGEIAHIALNRKRNSAIVEMPDEMRRELLSWL